MRKISEFSMHSGVTLIICFSVKILEHHIIGMKVHYLLEPH